MKYGLLPVFYLLMSSCSFAQDTTGKIHAMAWDFVRQKENRIWTINAGLVIPVGTLSLPANPETETSGYFYNNGSGSQNPVHLTSGAAFNFMRRKVFSRTQNGKLSLAYLLSPLNVVAIHYDFRSVSGSSEASKIDRKPFFQYGFSGGYELNFKSSDKLSASAFVTTSVFGQSVSGHIILGTPKIVQGASVTNVTYSYVGGGALLNGGVLVQLTRFRFGIDYCYTVADGNYYVSDYNWINGFFTNSRKIVFSRAQYFRISIGFDFRKKIHTS